MLNRLETIAEITFNVVMATALIGWLVGMVAGMAYIVVSI